MNIWLRKMLVVLALAPVAGCTGIKTTGPGMVGIERTQYMFDPLPARELNEAYAQAYGQAVRRAAADGKLMTETPAGERVIDIARKIVDQTPAFRPGAERWGWFVNVIKDDQINANCGPGGKILVYTGLIDRLQLTDDELAIVLAHEVGHALREHSREQISSNAGFEITGTLGSAALGAGAAGKTVISKALGLGVGNTFSRRDEMEADLIGLELAARAGYDPNAAQTMWAKMGKEKTKGIMPAFLGTHPSDEKRMARLADATPKVMPLYKQSAK